MFVVHCKQLIDYSCKCFLITFLSKWLYLNKTHTMWLIKFNNLHLMTVKEPPIDIFISKFSDENELFKKARELFWA